MIFKEYGRWKLRTVNNRRMEVRMILTHIRAERQPQAKVVPAANQLNFLRFFCRNIRTFLVVNA